MQGGHEDHRGRLHGHGERPGSPAGQTRVDADPERRVKLYERGPFLPEQWSPKESTPTGDQATSQH